MAPAAEKFSSFVALAQSRNFKEIRSNLLVAAVTAVLLYFIQWPALRAGLTVIVVSRVLLAAVSFRRHSSYRKLLDRLSHDDFNTAGMMPWFDEEQKFVSRAKLLYAGPILGLMILGYGLWVQTRNLWIAIALGVVYPASIAFGVWNANDVRAIRLIRKQRSLMASLLARNIRSQPPL